MNRYFVCLNSGKNFFGAGHIIGEDCEVLNADRYTITKGNLVFWIGDIEVKSIALSNVYDVEPETISFSVSNPQARIFSEYRHAISDEGRREMATALSKMVELP